MKEVKVYSAPWCAGCKTVKKYLDKNEIKYSEIDITSTEGIKEVKELGILSIPVTSVNGKLFVGSSNGVIESLTMELFDD